MKRALYFIVSGFELLRFFSLIILVGLIPFDTVIIPLVLKILIAPHIIFAVALFFLGIDPITYNVYRHIFALGKAISFVSIIAGLFIAVFETGLSQYMLIAIFMLCLIALWDAISIAIVLLNRTKLQSGSDEHLDEQQGEHTIKKIVE